MTVKTMSGTNWYNLPAAEVVERLDSDAERGLSDDEAARRLAEHGPNELVERGGTSPWRMLLEQFTSAMVIVLILAAIVSAALGDFRDATVILAIVVLNAALGFSQEYRADKAMRALKQLAVPTVRVRRSGRVTYVSSRELVPGDIILLEAGGLVPADGRLLESANLRVQEAVLTGESEPVEKVDHVVPEVSPTSEENIVPQAELLIGDRLNMLYMGTMVTYGRGVAVVTETGMSAELGRIASMIQTLGRETTPLQRRLGQLGKWLGLAALALVALIFVLGLLRGEDPRLMFLTAVSVGVAAVPEGLLAVVTVALALGAQRMLQRHALIRKLPAVETLGSVTVICSDKTGTLTENRMAVTVLDVAGHRLDMRVRGFQGDPAPGGGIPSGTADLNLDLADCEAGDGYDAIPNPRTAIGLLLAGGALCNDAHLVTANVSVPSGTRVPPGIEAPGEVSEDRPSYQAVGDPTEGALAVAAARSGLCKGELERCMPRVAEEPFDSARKRMTTVHRWPTCRCQVPGSLQPAYDWSTHISGEAHPLRGPVYVAFTKGAVDHLLEVSSHVWVADHAEAMDEQWRERVLAGNSRLAQSGMRVLGVAFRPVTDHEASCAGEGGIEHDLVFVGMVGMVDPARPEVKEAVRTCKEAGIRPVMITGDHHLTAEYIAGDLDISGDGGARWTLTGQELDRLPPGELERIVDEVPVYARVSPEHKLSIVQALQNRGHIVAMTGDGVNDAPALKKADIGVAMGVVGTDVSKEAADMVLLDDNFATIVHAVREGRIIYDNIRKFIRYMLTSNSGELWVVLLGPALAMPLPLLPLQILWINLLTDGLPALAIAVEPAEHDVMRRPPYRPQESLLGRGMVRRIIWVGLLMGLLSLGTGFLYWQNGSAGWQTMIFTVLTFSQLGLALAVRSERRSLFTIGLLSNRLLLGAVALTFLLQLAVIYIPLLQEVFGTVPLGLSDLALCAALSTVVFWAVELEKWWSRRRGTVADR
jgi:Ca2+-transporting ATPase